MKGKTKVELINDIHQTDLKKGDTGYIDGYVKGGDNSPCAVIVVKSKIYLAPVHNLKVIY